MHETTMRLEEQIIAARELSERYQRLCARAGRTQWTIAAHQAARAVLLSLAARWRAAARLAAQAGDDVRAQGCAVCADQVYDAAEDHALWIEFALTAPAEGVA